MDAQDFLPGIGVMPWQYYADSLELSNILIGNGFSINLCDRLKYDNLFNIFKSGKSSELVNLFRKLDTTNFEYVISILNNTITVNSIYGVDNKVLQPITEELKKGLIEVISRTHPLYKDISPEIFRSLAVEVAHFGDIYATNYDIFLYKIILAYNDLLDKLYVKGNRYKDDSVTELANTFWV